MPNPTNSTEDHGATSYPEVRYPTSFPGRPLIGGFRRRQVHPRNRPSVDQLLQMPQMLRHSSGIREEPWDKSREFVNEVIGKRRAAEVP